MGCCDSEGEVKLWECSTGVLLIGCLALLEAQRAKFLLADRAAGVVTSAVRGTEFLLAAVMTLPGVFAGNPDNRNTTGSGRVWVQTGIFSEPRD